MRRISGKLGAVALGMALAGSVGMGGAAFAKDKPAAAPKATNSPEFVKAAQTLQKAVADAVASKDKATAQALVPQLAAAEPTVKTGLDKIIFGQWQQQLGTIIGDQALQQRGLRNMLDSGQLTPDKVATVGYFLGATAYQNKDYATAISALGPVIASNYTEDVAAEMLADAYAKQGQPAQGLAALKTAIDVRKKAGGTVPAAWYTRGNTIAYGAKLKNEGIEWALAMAGNTPSAINWLGAGQLIRLYGSYGKEDSLDISRLLFRSGALAGNSKDIEREYVEYVQDADPRKLPGEALAAAKAGIAAGALKASDTFVADSIAQSQGRVAADKASLPGAAKSAATGAVAMSVADGFLSYGQAAEAEAMYKTAIAKGGVDTERATLRMAIAQADQGKTADAKATFAKVTGTRAPIAQLWTTWLGTKGA